MPLDFTKIDAANIQLDDAIADLKAQDAGATPEPEPPPVDADLAERVAILEEQVAAITEALEMLVPKVNANTAAIDDLDNRVTALEAGGGTEPPDPEPPEEYDWINKPANAKITIDGDGCTVEAPPRADAFQMTADGKNVHVSVKPGETSNVGRARSEFRTNEYIPDSWHVEFDVVLGGASLGSGSENYNVMSQYHPDNDTENPSASINYQSGKFTVQRSEGTGSTIRDVGSIAAKSGDRINVIWDVIFGTSNQGQLRCALMNRTTGESKIIEALNVNLGRTGRKHNFKAGTYRSVANVAFEAHYYDLVISHPALGFSVV